MRTIIHSIGEWILGIGIIGVLFIPLSYFIPLDWLPEGHLIIGTFIVIVDIGLFIGFIYAFLKLLKYRPRLEVGKKPVRQLLTLKNAYFRDRWKKIKTKYTAAPTVDSMRLAVIETDSLIDHVLRDLNFPGEHLADRLSYLNNHDIRSLDGLWEAHRLRNEIVHRPGASLSVREGTQALLKYERFLKEIKIL